MKYQIPKRVFLVQKYYEHKSFTLVQRAYKAEYKTKVAPNRNTIENIIRVFEKTGSVGFMVNKKKEPSEKRKVAKNQLETMIAKFPNLSIRKAASSLQVSPTLVFTILHDDLHIKPYKYHQWHKLEEHDYEKRLNFAKWFVSLPKNAKFHFIFSDEAYFYLHLPLNKQNNRIWSDSDPFLGVEIPLHDQKVMVWCAISAAKVYGPHFFSENVNQHNYLDMLKNFFWKRHLNVEKYKEYYFQQDGATPHTTNKVQEWLKDKFSEKFVDKLSWPPRSPDLNPCDFYLWGYLKSVVYNPLPKTLDDLKENITREIRKISKDTLKSTFLNLEKRCNLILSAGGGHIEE